MEHQTQYSSSPLVPWLAGFQFHWKAGGQSHMWEYRLPGSDGLVVGRGNTTEEAFDDWLRQALDQGPWHGRVDWHQVIFYAAAFGVVLFLWWLAYCALRALCP